MFDTISDEKWALFVALVKEQGYKNMVEDLAIVCVETGACNECPSNGNCEKQGDVNVQEMV